MESEHYSFEVLLRGQQFSCPQMKSDPLCPRAETVPRKATGLGLPAPDTQWLRQILAMIKSFPILKVKILLLGGFVSQKAKSVDRRRGRRERSRSNLAKHSGQSHLPGFLWISVGFDSHFTGRSDRRRGRLWACCQLKDLETVATLSGVGQGAKDWAEL